MQSMRGNDGTGGFHSIWSDLRGVEFPHGYVTAAGVETGART